MIADKLGANHRLHRLRLRWFPATAWAPGYWGRLPYLLILRVLGAIGLWLRFGWDTDWPTPAMLAATLLILLAYILNTRRYKSTPRRTYILLVGADIAVVGTAYWYADRIDSDLYLLFALPIITAAEYLTATWVIVAAVTSTFVFALVLATMPVEPSLSAAARFDASFPIFMPRVVYFLGFVTLSALRLERERLRRQWLTTRQMQMRAIFDCRNEVDRLFGLDVILKTVVQRAAGGLELAHAAGVLQRPSPEHAPGRSNEAGGAQGQVLEWAVGPDAAAREDAIRRCRRVIGGKPDEQSATVTVLGEPVGALAVTGLHGDDLRNAVEYLTALAQLVSVSYERARLLHAVRAVGAVSAIAVEHNSALEALLDELVDSLGFDYATISLVEPYQAIIQTVRGRNVPPGWIKTSRHSLGSNDILADIVRHNHVVILDRFDDRLNFGIWRRYQHDRLARVFAPIVATLEGKEEVVGVIEAGCQKERRSDALDPNVDHVTRLGRTLGGRIVHSAPTRLLERIASEALTLIGAQSASLHIFRGRDQFLVASVGSVPKDFLQKFPPSEHGIGRQAIVTGKPVIENELPARKAALRDIGLCSMAAFPLALSEEVTGVLYIHYWRHHTFESAEVEIVGAFLPHMIEAMRNHLLISGFSKSEERAWMLTGLQNVLRSLGSAADTPPLLDQLAHDIRYMLDAESVTLYEYFQSTRTLSRAVLAGRIADEASLTSSVGPEDIVTKIVADGKSRFERDARDPSSFLVQPRSQDTGRPRFAHREGIASCAVLVLRSPYDAEIVGCLFANHVERRDFDASYQQLAHVLAGAVAVAIKSARLQAAAHQASDLDRRQQREELEAVRRFSAAILAQADRRNRHRLCEAILDEAFRVLGEGLTLGDVLLRVRDSEILEPHAARGYDQPMESLRWRVGEGIVGRAAEIGQSILVPDVEQNLRYREVCVRTRCELAVPIKAADGKVLGVINVEHANVQAFSPRDQAFLELLAMQASIGLDIADLTARLHEEVEQALALRTIATRIQQPGLSTAAALRQLLVGITAHVGLGFSRAMLFEISEDGSTLAGRGAIGGLTRQEAEKIWRRVGGLPLDVLLDRAVMEAEGQYTLSDPALDQAVAAIEVTADSLPEAVRRCLAPKGQMQPMTDAEFVGTRFSALYRSEDDGQQANEPCKLSCVPLSAGNRAVGLMVIDNRFLNHQRGVAPEAKPMLVAFAEVMAMVVDGARLRGRLVEEKQLKDWRTSSGRVAHVLEGTRYCMHRRWFPACAATSTGGNSNARGSVWNS